MQNKKRGFTLIELLVVIAIIGILSSVVLASLNSARTKGKDASAKASIASIRSSAEVYYNGSGANTYGTVTAGDGSNSGNVCADADVAKLLTAAGAQTGNTAVCAVATAGAGYTAYITLNDTTNFCVDSTGFSGTRGATAGVAAGNYTAGSYCVHP